MIPRIEILLIILTVLFMTSCRIGETTTPLLPTITVIPTNTPTPTAVDTGLVYGKPCRPPCWQGLTPGKTTYQEAVQLLEQLYISGQVESIYTNPKWFDVDTTGNTTSFLFGRFEDDLLKNINGGIEFYYPIGTLVEQVGVPEGLYPIGKNTSTSGHACDQWEPPQPITAPMQSTMSIHLLYPQRGLYFLMLQKGGGYICPQMQVTSFCYYKPLSMSEALKDDYLANLCNIEGLKNFSKEYLIEWHGFGGGY